MMGGEISEEWYRKRRAHHRWGGWPTKSAIAERRSRSELVDEVREAAEALRGKYPHLARAVHDAAELLESGVHR
jgi:hypothetical protein